MTTNRNPLKRMFITFPQTETDKKLFYQSICIKFPTDYSLTAQESHLDGNHHLHSALIFTKSVSKSRVLNHLKGVYPDDWKRITVESMRSINHSVEYLQKEDLNPYTTGKLPKTKDSKRLECLKWYQEFIKLGQDILYGEDFDQWYNSVQESIAPVEESDTTNPNPN